jgi:transglutaminase-like putative cysteine protease
MHAVRLSVPYLDFISSEPCASESEITAAVKLAAPISLTPFTVAKALSEYIYENFEYKKGITSVESSIDEVWKLRAGVCQDFANILLVMLRYSGIPSRYVSGYICPKNHDLRGEGATHAWVDAYIPYHGWIGIDPTNNCVVSDRHVRLSVGRGFGDCTPVKGLYKGSGEHTLEVSVSIENGLMKKDFSPNDPLPSYGYSVKRSDPEDNSYRRFLETQQQQQ